MISWPMVIASSAPRSCVAAMCLFGTTSTCVGATGRMSRNASECSSSYTTSAGIFFSIMVQKRHPIFRLLSSLGDALDDGFHETIRRSRGLRKKKRRLDELELHQSKHSGLVAEDVHARVENVVREWREHCLRELPFVLR